MPVWRSWRSLAKWIFRNPYWEVEGLGSWRLSIALSEEKEVRPVPLWHECNDMRDTRGERSCGTEGSWGWTTSGCRGRISSIPCPKIILLCYWLRLFAWVDYITPSIAVSDLSVTEKMVQKALWRDMECSSFNGSYFLPRWQKISTRFSHLSTYPLDMTWRYSDHPYSNLAMGAIFRAIFFFSHVLSITAWDKPVEL